MIVDWDVHHGNGTQDAFYADPGVLFVSLHQQNWYPKLSGELEQVGSGAGAGYTVNIPLPAGTGDRGYRAAFEQLVVPVGTAISSTTYSCHGWSGCKLARSYGTYDGDDAGVSSDLRN